MLVDFEIQALQKEYGLIDFGEDNSIDGDYSASAKIQASSVDLCIGNIYAPRPSNTMTRTVEDILSRVTRTVSKPFPVSRYSLRPGHTVVVESDETMNFPEFIAGIVFPPSRLAADGILSTNAGHVDAGFSGKLSLTLVNIGRDARELHIGQQVFTLILFRTKPAQQPYTKRMGQESPAPAVTAERLACLSGDFLQIEKRAKQIARTEAHRIRWFWTIMAPLIIFSFSLAATAVYGHVDTLKKQVSDLEEDVTVLKVKEGLLP